MNKSEKSNICVKEVYSNICMKIHISSKLTQYLINVFKMAFPMRNCLNYVQQCQNGIFKKTCQQQQYHIQLCGTPLDD